MDPGVLREVGAVGERLATTRTFIWFGLPQMDLCVELKIRFTSEDLKIHGFNQCIIN